MISARMVVSEASAQKFRVRSGVDISNSFQVILPIAAGTPIMIAAVVPSPRIRALAMAMIVRRCVRDGAGRRTHVRRVSAMAMSSITMSATWTPRVMSPNATAVGRSLRDSVPSISAVKGSALTKII